MQNKAVEPLLFLLMVFFWGSNYIIVKIAYLYDNSATLILLRDVYAFVFSAILFYRHVKIPNSLRENAKLFIFGNLNITGFFTLWFFAENYVSASLTSIIIYSYPIISTLFAYLFAGEKLGKIKFSGIIIGFMGIVIIFLKNITYSNYIYLVMLILGAMSWAGGTVFYRKYLTNYDPANTNTIQLLYAFPGILIISFFFGGININMINIKLNLVMIYMGFLGTAIAYFIFLLLYKKYNVASISAYFFTVPIISVVLSIVILNEVVNYYTVIGLIIVCIGIFISGRFK